MKRVSLFLLLCLLSGGMVFALRVQPAPAGDFGLADADFLVVRAYYHDPAMVQELATWKEPWEVDQEAGYVLLDIHPADQQRLADLGFRIEIDWELTEDYNRPRTPVPGQGGGIPGYECYRTVEETFATAEQLAVDYPDFVTWTDIGDSWDKATPGGPAGYDMQVLSLTNQNIPGPKPAVYIFGSIHAREYVAAEIATRFAEHLLQGYGVDPDTTWVLDHHQIEIVLQANPDGRKFAEAGQLWRKNTNNTDGCVSSYGVDLNRNFEFYWNSGGTSSDPCSDIYRGSTAASEPETQALQAYAYNIFPDQREDPINAAAPITTTGIFLDLHSYAQEILWPWGFTSTPPANGTQMQTLARKMGYYSGYDATQSLYATSGTTKDFMYGEFGVPGYTVEIGTTFFQACPYFESTIWPNEMLPLLEYVTKAPRYSYIIPAGPDTDAVTLSAGVVTAGDLIDLSALADDTRYNNSTGTEPTQNIVAAEYYVDTPDWMPGAIALPMTASDGAFNSPVENVGASLDTTGLSSGRHLVYVRGQDAAGNWGAYSAAFLDVIDPAVAPVVQGTVTDSLSGAPLAATVSTPNTQTTTDPATGFYQLQVISGTHTLTVSASEHAVQTTTVVAQDYQTVQQDFSLLRLYPRFSDDVEGGNIGWTAVSPWAISSETAYSPNHAWSDSPGGNYTNNRNVYLRSPIIDMGTLSSAHLSFWHICDTEYESDYCIVEASDDGGASWTELARYSGAHTEWEEVILPAPMLDNQTDARVRFRFTSDAGGTADGWHVDDIKLLGTGSSCASSPPVAAFTSNSPVPLGDPAVFSNSSSGSCLSFRWDFGDGSPISNFANPLHTYAAAGSYTVTLTATNEAGSDTFVTDVTVEPAGVAPTAFFTTSATLVEVGEPVSFANQSTGTNLTYEWDFGDGSPVSAESDPVHAYMSPGIYTVELTASNALGTDTYSVEITVLEGDGLPEKLYLPIQLGN